MNDLLPSNQPSSSAAVDDDQPSSDQRTAIYDMMDHSPINVQPAMTEAERELEFNLQIEEDIRYEDVEHYEDDEGQETSHAPEPEKKIRDGYIYPLRVEKEEKARHINLLLTDDDGCKHYSSIIDFSRLCRSQVSKHNGRMHFCYSCLTGFSTSSADETRDKCKRLQEHMKLCTTHDAQRVSYPTKEDDDNKIRFTNIRKQLAAPFVIYADFEAALAPTFDEAVPTGIEDPELQKKYLDDPPGGMTKKGERIWREEASKAVKYQEHKAVSYNYLITSNVPGYQTKSVIYKGEDAAEHFLDSVSESVRHIFDEYIKKPKKIIMDQDAEERFEAATCCHICKKEFGAGDKRVKDHDHFTG